MAERKGLRIQKLAAFLLLSVIANVGLGVGVAYLGQPRVAAAIGFILLAMLPFFVKGQEHIKAIDRALESGEVLEFAEYEKKQDPGYTGRRFEITRHGHILLSQNGKWRLSSAFTPRSKPVWLAKRGVEPGPLTIAERAEIVSRLLIRRSDRAGCWTAANVVIAIFLVRNLAEGPWPFVFFALVPRLCAERPGPSRAALDSVLDDPKCVPKTKHSKHLVVSNDVSWSEYGQPAEWRSQSFFD